MNKLMKVTISVDVYEHIIDESTIFVNFVNIFAIEVLVV